MARRSRVPPWGGGVRPPDRVEGDEVSARVLKREEDVQRAVVAAIVREELRQIDEADRVIFEKRWIEGTPYAAVSDELHQRFGIELAPGAVKVRAHRIRRRFQGRVRRRLRSEHSGTARFFEGVA